MDDELQATICYYARLGYGRHIQRYCDKQLLKRPKDHVLLFWHAFGLILEGSLAEALRELQAISDHREVELAAVAAMIHTHQLCPEIDGEGDLLDQRLLSLEKSGSERALFHVSTLYLYLGGTTYLNKAKDLTSKILQTQPGSVPFKCLSAWIKMKLENDLKSTYKSPVQYMELCNIESSVQQFHEVLEQNNYINAFLGRAYYYELKQKYTQAVDELNQVIALYPWYLPAFCEKGRVGLLTQDWVMVQEISQAILQKDLRSVEALLLNIQVMLCTGNDAGNLAQMFDNLLTAIEEREPCNGYLCLEVGRTLARIGGRGRPVVLQKTLALIKSAQGLLPHQSSLCIEMAYQQFLLADYADALENYRLAAQLSQLSIEPMYGSVQCLLLRGDIEEAEQQLEVLAEVSVSVGKSASLCWLMAQLAWMRAKSYKDCLDLLIEGAILQKKVATEKRDSFFYSKLDPDRVLAMAHMFVVLSVHESKSVQVDQTSCLKQSVSLLEFILEFIPGFLMGHLMLAEVFIQLDELDSASDCLQIALDLDPTCSVAQILLSQVQVKLEKFELAKQRLEQALSDSFLIRDSIKYHVLQAQIMMNSQENGEALKVLESALLLPEMKQVAANRPMSYYFSSNLNTLADISADSDRVLVFLLLADVHVKFGHTLEATKILQDAMSLFAGTPEQAQVHISSASLALRRDDVTAAIAMLRQVPRESKHYIKAMMAMASAYLTYWHDTSMYAICFKEMVQNCPSSKTFVMLGDAYMSIDELDNALEAYEAAIRKNPEDVAIATQVGRALLKSHNYNKAVEHYEIALDNAADNYFKLTLFYDLAELYYKLKRHDQAERLLRNMLTRAEAYIQQKESTKSTCLMLCLRGSLLLAKVQSLLGTSKTVSEVMTSARKLQSRIPPRCQGQQDESAKEQNAVAAEIYHEFAKECETRKDLDKTVTLLLEALKCNEMHIPSMLALARIHLSSGNIGESEQNCAAALKIDPFNREAGEILVRLMLYKGVYETAILHFKQNLENDPNHYYSLSQLIKLLRCSGQIDEAQKFVVMAEKASPQASTHAGFYFCQGLLARYMNKSSVAVQMLNRSRSDPEWVKQALYLLIEIYLNIDNELIWEQANHESANSGNEEGIKAAWKLLGENRILDGQSINQLVLECYATMATRQKADIDFALGRLTEMASKEVQNVSILLAIATAHTLLKQTAKAKNQLRAIDRMVYKWEDGENIERAWLMLASILLQAGKLDATEELCKRCLKYNRDCARAWEYLGVLTEQGHSAGDALVYFETAWKSYKETSPSAGYRLASAYLKSKRYIEAITICHKIFKICPNFPRAKKEILDKARLCVRL